MQGPASHGIIVNRYGTIWFTMPRVVITGIGAVTPLGTTFGDSWQSACAGMSGIRAISRVQTPGMRWTVSGEVRGFDPLRYLSAREIRRVDLFARYAVASAVMAAADAGLIAAESMPQPGEDYLSAGSVIIGSSRGGIGTIEEAILKSAHAPHARTSSYLMPATTVSMAASFTAQKLGIKGHCLGVSNACTSGTNAVGEAYRILRSGYSGPVFAGGADAPVCRICIEGYGSAGALSRVPDQFASRPFDRRRDGFVLSEGACVLVVERLEEALKRRAHVYAEIIGYGSTTDAFHQTHPHPDGEARAIRAALEMAGVSKGEIDFISAHGTSTPLGDLSESRAICRVFGGQTDRIPVSAMKSMTGHMLAASGAFETASTAMAIDQGIIFPTINLSAQDKEIPLKIATKATRANLRNAIINSFGFGGVNAVLVLRRPGADG